MPSSVQVSVLLQLENLVHGNRAEFTCWIVVHGGHSRRRLDESFQQTLWNHNPLQPHGHLQDSDAAWPYVPRVGSKVVDECGNHDSFRCRLVAQDHEAASSSTPVDYDKSSASLPLDGFATGFGPHLACEDLRRYCDVSLGAAFEAQEMQASRETLQMLDRLSKPTSPHVQMPGLPQFENGLSYAHHGKMSSDSARLPDLVSTRPNDAEHAQHLLMASVQLTGILSPCVWEVSRLDDLRSTDSVTGAGNFGSKKQHRRPIDRAPTSSTWNKIEDTISNFWNDSSISSEEERLSDLSFGTHKFQADPAILCVDVKLESKTKRLFRFEQELPSRGGAKQASIGLFNLNIAIQKAPEGDCRHQMQNIRLPINVPYPVGSDEQNLHSTSHRTPIKPRIFSFKTEGHISQPSAANLRHYGPSETKPEVLVRSLLSHVKQLMLSKGDAGLSRIQEHGLSATDVDQQQVPAHLVDNTMTAMRMSSRFQLQKLGRPFALVSLGQLVIRPGEAIHISVTYLKTLPAVSSLSLTLRPTKPLHGNTAENLLPIYRTSDCVRLSTSNVESTVCRRRTVIETFVPRAALSMMRGSDVSVGWYLQLDIREGRGDKHAATKSETSNEIDDSRIERGRVVLAPQVSKCERLSVRMPVNIVPLVSICDETASWSDFI